MTRRILPGQKRHKNRRNGESIPAVLVRILITYLTKTHFYRGRTAHIQAQNHSIAHFCFPPNSDIMKSQRRNCTMKDKLKGVGIWGQRHYQCLKENFPTPSPISKEKCSKKTATRSTKCTPSPNKRHSNTASRSAFA